MKNETPSATVPIKKLDEIASTIEGWGWDSSDAGHAMAQGAAKLIRDAIAAAPQSSTAKGEALNGFKAALSKTLIALTQEHGGERRLDSSINTHVAYVQLFDALTPFLSASSPATRPSAQRKPESMSDAEWNEALAVAAEDAALRQQLTAMTDASDEQLRSNAQNWQTILDLRAERDRLQVELDALKQKPIITEVICGPDHSFELVKNGTVAALRAQNAKLIAELQKQGKPSRG